MPNHPSPPSSPSPPSPTGCLTGIVFAMPVEADAFAARARETVEYTAAAGRILEGIVADRRVAWSVSGAGGEAAGRTTRLLIAGHRPALIVSAGFAGALAPTLARGSVVHPHRGVGGTGGRPIMLAGAGQGDRSGGHTIVSVDRVVATAAAKRELASTTGASLVDMETYAVATAALAAGLPCASIRVISDDAAQDLPREIAALVQPQSGMRRLGTAIGAIGRRPQAAVDMWRLWEHAVVDGRTLAAAIERFLESLSRDQQASGRRDSSADRP